MARLPDATSTGTTQISPRRCFRSGSKLAGSRLALIAVFDVLDVSSHSTTSGRCRQRSVAFLEMTFAGMLAILDLSFLVNSDVGFMIGILANFLTNTGTLEPGLDVDEVSSLATSLSGTSRIEISFLSVIWKYFVFRSTRSSLRRWLLPKRIGPEKICLIISYLR